jgi:hypothetical protein
LIICELKGKKTLASILRDTFAVESALMASEFTNYGIFRNITSVVGEGQLIYKV